jgi:hypothetical protein
MPDAITDEEKIEVLNKAMDLFEHVGRIETGDDQEDAALGAEVRRSVAVLESIRADITRLARPRVGNAMRH